MEFVKSNFWALDMKSVTVVVHGIKYRIECDQNQITIRRKVNDIWDLMGFTQLKLMCIAEGEIKEQEKSITVNLETRLSHTIEVLLITAIIIFGCLGFWIVTQDFSVGAFYILVLILVFGVQYLIFRTGLSDFYSDLKRDIDYFASEKIKET